MSKYDLSDAEYKIMEYIWRCDETKTFNEIMEFTQTQGYTWKKQTIQTFLTRLIDKGALAAEKKGNKRYYTPALTEEEYTSKWTKGLLSEGFGGSLKNFLLAFSGGETLSKQDVKELREFLDEL